MRWLSIDPGAKGGYAVWQGRNLLYVNDLHLTDDNLPLLYNEWKNEFAIQFALIEKQQSMTGQGVRSIFSTGEGYGKLIALTRLVCGENVYTVHPVKWTRYFKKIRGTEGTAWNKHDSLYYLIDLGYDESAFRGPRGGLKDGRVDAVMIGLWGIECLSDLHQKFGVR